MPIPLPNLDDRTYSDLIDEIQALIPRYAPEWTDHNESDPGIMLIEMFAWLAEALLYRTNRITKKSEHRMLALLGIPLLQADGSQLTLDEKRALAVDNLRTRWRAITIEDFEQWIGDFDKWIIENQVSLSNAGYRIVRAKCLPELDLTAIDPYTPRPGHVSVIIVPFSQNQKPVPSNELMDSVWRFLDERRLITCRHHVVGPVYSDIKVEAEIVRISQVEVETLKKNINTQLHKFFNPLTGGPQEAGWPFGRDVYASEVYQLIECQAGVDHVETLTLSYYDKRVSNKSGSWKIATNHCVQLPPNNLVHLVESELTVRV